MKKTKLLLLTMALVMLAVASLAGCGLFKDISFDDVKANLESAGYEVTVMTGEQYAETENAYSINANELKKYLYAVKGNEVLELFVFNTVDNASDNSNFMPADGKYSGQSNEVVYLATKQAKKDAKL